MPIMDPIVIGPLAAAGTQTVSYPEKGTPPDLVLPSKGTAIVCTSADNSSASFRNDGGSTDTATFYFLWFYSVPKNTASDFTPYLWAGGATGVITGGPRYIDVTDYGAVGDGATNNLTPVRTAIAAAKAANLPLYFPAGTYLVTFAVNNDKWLIDWNDAEIFGDGPNVSIIKAARTNASFVVSVFQIAHPYNVFIHDIGFTSNFTQTSTSDPATSSVYIPAKTGNPTDQYTVRLLRVNSDSFYSAVYSEAGSVNSINYLTVDIEDCDLMSWTIPIRMFSDNNSSGTKSLHARKTRLQNQNKASAAASHLMYIHPQCNILLDRMTFSNWGAGEYAIHHYGTAPVAPTYCKYAIVSNCTWTSSGDGYAAIATYLGPTTFIGGTVGNRTGFQCRNTTNFFGVNFKPTPEIVGTISLISRFGTAVNSTLNVSGCTVDLSAVGSNAVQIIGYGAVTAADNITVNVSDMVVTARNECTFTVMNTDATGTGSGGTYNLSNIQVNAYDGTTSAVQFLVGASGTFYVDRCTIKGDSSVDRGVFRFDFGSDIVLVEISNCSTVGLTKGFPLYTNSTSAGKIRTRGNIFGTSNTLSRLDCTVGVQYCQFTKQYYSTTAAPASTTLTAWAINTEYRVGQLVQNDTGKTYRCITAGTSAGAGGPTGTGADIVDNTVHWTYVQTSTTTRMTSVYNDFNEYTASGVVDTILVNGRFNDTTAFQGARVFLYSTGTLQLTALGNIVSLSGAVRAAGTQVQLRQDGGLWYEI